MDYNRATTRLIDGVTLKELAKELDTSYGFLRLSRLDPDNPGYSRPPAGWEDAVLKLARRRVKELEKLVTDLERDEAAPVARKAAKKAGAKSNSRKRARALRRR
jgi:hypothetical protein